MKINNTQNPATPVSSPSVKRAARGAALALFLGLASTCPAISTHTTDFIADGTRTYFNGFEGMPATSSAAPSYTEDSIRVDQINGQVNDIWTGYASWGVQGSRSWYPNAGDFGYTRITLSDGSDFGDVGFLRGSGSSHVALFYELYENGSLV